MCGTKALVIKIVLGLQCSGSCAKKILPIKIRNKNILDTCQDHTKLAFQYVASMQQVTLSDMHVSMDRLATCCLTFKTGMCCKYTKVVITFGRKS